MKGFFIKILGLVIIIIAFSSFTNDYELSEDGNSIIIKGTSNLHDWQMNVVSSIVEAQFSHEGSQLKSIDKAVFSCKIADIKSDNSLMDKKTYEALKAQDFQLIHFDLLQKSELSVSAKTFKGNLQGSLFIAGVRKNISVPFSGVLNDDNTLSIKGSVDMKMSDFNIKAPTALLGTLKTGDKVTIDFSLNLMNNS